MVTETSNCTWIKDHLEVTTNPIVEALSPQGVVVDDMCGFNDDVHKSACYTTRMPGGGNNVINVSSIMESRLSISIHDTKYYEDAEKPI